MKFLYISIIIFLISLVFLFIQGIINNKFYRTNDRKIIVERYLYEQFSEEIYSSINRYISYDLTNKTDECQFGDGFYLNLDTYFDCRGIYNKDLNKFCQNEIINNNTECLPDKTIDINLNNINKSFEYDERAIYCKYYSRYKMDIKELFNKKICIKKDANNLYKYEDLLKNSISSNEKFCPYGFKKCGILDTKKNILCWDSSKDCPRILNVPETEKNEVNNLTDYLINDINSDIIISIIISENQPLNHEFNTIVKNKYTKLSDEEKNKRKNISGEDYKLFDSEYDNTYKYLENSEQMNFKVENFSNNIEKYKYNLDQNLNVYTRNYIGFKNLEELHTFQLHFSADNPTDNPLYKLSYSRHNPLITIIFSVVFFVISIAYLILKIINKLADDIYAYLLKIYSAIDILFFIGGIIIVIYHFVIYPLISIDMDERMKVVLDKYNKRRMDFQKFRITSIIINSISIVFLFISYKKTDHNHQD